MNRYAWTLNIFHTFFSVSVIDFEQVNVCWVQAFQYSAAFIVEYCKLSKQSEHHYEMG